MSIDPILKRFPKDRPPLPEGYEEIAYSEYAENRKQENKIYSLSGYIEGWMHRCVARSGNDIEPGQVLEIGAGTLNHLPFESSYTDYDVIEPYDPFFDLASNPSGIRNRFKDISEVPNELVYSRIFSVAVLEHVANLPEVIAVAGTHLVKGGVFQAGIPTEGGWLWGFMNRKVMGFFFRRRTGLDYAPLMDHEHINTANEIEALINYCFRDVKKKRFPLPFFSLSFYTYFEASDVYIERCNDIIEYYAQSL